MGSGGRRVVSRGGRRRSLAVTDRPPPVGAPSGGSTGGFWGGGSGSKSSGGGAGRPLPQSPSPPNNARLSAPTPVGGVAADGAGVGSLGGGGGGAGAGGPAASGTSLPREYSSAASGFSTSLSSVIPGILRPTDIDVYGRGDDAVFGPGAAAATQYEAAAALEATRRRTSMVREGEHVDRDGWGRGDSAIFGRGASAIAARDAAAAYRRVQRRSARRGYIIPAAALIEGRWRREQRPDRWIGSQPASAAASAGGLSDRAGGGSAAADATASSAGTMSARAGSSAVVPAGPGSFVASGGTHTSLDMGGDDHFVPVTAGGTYLDRTDEPRSLPRGLTGSSTGSALAFPAADDTDVGGVEEPATADLFDSDDMALLASYGRQRGAGDSAGSSGALWGAAGGRASGSTEEPSTSELLRDETGLEAAAAVAAREAAAARGEEYDEGLGGKYGGGAAGFGSRTSPVVAEGGAYGVRIYLDGGADSDSESSSGAEPPAGNELREYSPEVEALLFGDDSENDGDVEESVQGGGDGRSEGGAASGGGFIGATGRGVGERRRSSAGDEHARDLIEDDVGEDSWPLGDGVDIYAGTTGAYETDGSQGGATLSMSATDEWAGATAGFLGGGRYVGASDGIGPSSRGGGTTDTVTAAAAAATAEAVVVSTVSAVESLADGWGSEADTPSSSARFASASTDLSVPGVGVLMDGESDADALRAPEDEQDREAGGEHRWPPLAAVPSSGNNDAEDGGADPIAVTAAHVGDSPAATVFLASDYATTDDSPPPLEATKGLAEGSPQPALAAGATAAVGTDPPAAPSAAVVAEPMLGTSPRERAATSAAAGGDKPASSPPGSQLAAAVLAADVRGSSTPPGGIPGASTTAQPSVAAPGELSLADEEADDVPSLASPSRLAAAAATVGSKATAGVAAAGSMLSAVAGVATGRGAGPTADAGVDAARSTSAAADDEVDDVPSQPSPSRLAAAVATVGSKATAGVAAAGSALAAVAGIATGRDAEPTAEADADASPGDAAGTEATEVAGGDLLDGASDAVAAYDGDEVQCAAGPTDGASAASLAAKAVVEREPAAAPVAERATDLAVQMADAPTAESIAEPAVQPAVQPAGGQPAADPATGAVAVHCRDVPAIGDAAEPDAAPTVEAAADAAVVPVSAIVAAASRPAETPAPTRSASAPVPSDAVSVDGGAAAAKPVAAYDGNDKAVAVPVDAVKVTAAEAELLASEAALADAPSEAADDDSARTAADVASDDDFTVDDPSTGSWDVPTASIGGVASVRAIPTAAEVAAAGGASGAASAAAVDGTVAADPASATEPDEADDYTTAIDGWEDSLVLARGGGGARTGRSVHFGRAPSSNATSATDDDARYYDARLELP